MQFAQLGHAAGVSAAAWALEHHSPLPDNTHVVAVEARDEDHLEELEARARLKGLPVFAIREPDAPYNGALMALGIGPILKKRMEVVLRGLPLLGSTSQKKGDSHV